ncbi:MAG: lysylphosphatidylglycerol synthase transmembrane domain-containing protein [Bacteroidota bacterium]|nr:lysylphosphatidylglycerol synthase transmembrane domain-containing protein [Bacteroidota bacterium]
MKKKSLFINFLVSIIFGLLLLYFVFQKIDLSVFFARLDSVNYSWIWLSIIISIFEHIIRAFRWNLLMEKESDSLTTFNTTIVLIVSYFTSLIFPRFNDFVRCYLISKTNTIKLSTSLGTVVSERIVDVLSLIVLALLLLVIEYEIFVNLLIDIVSKINFDFINVVFIVIAIVIVSYLFKILIKRNDFINLKFKEFKIGLFAFKDIYYRWDFLLSTFFLWVIYYLMGYVIFFALQETSHLGFNAGLAVLVAGTLGMIVPVNAGIGAYHFLVASILLNYTISYEAGLFFATLIHGSQVVSLILFGFVSSILLFIIIRSKSKNG